MLQALPKVQKKSDLNKTKSYVDFIFMTAAVRLTNKKEVVSCLKTTSLLYKTITDNKSAYYSFTIFLMRRCCPLTTCT